MPLNKETKPNTVISVPISGTYSIRISMHTSSDKLGKIADWVILLVSLFNGISTLFRLFNAKAILLEEQ